ncbi:hypothetical protein HYFRA_00010736 [Hymenoscyphus fraxineus]|uniref:Major facilitator superfamily (MFS) profile domain-containing protein n=1 Tax=Hymenoscyphus fraxineus TaxID=746836 RepID=A0A9N9L356_9HELO|nr:hypothetical protein HYFRA_00010736 [Hymenoscyphus fraxineus]
MGIFDRSTCTSSSVVSSHDALPDETTPLLKGKDTTTVSVSACDPEADAVVPEPCTDKQSLLQSCNNVTGVISILLLGVFIANADVSLVLATSGTISSEFGQLGNAGWLYGKLSDIYGRKNTIIASYVFFAVGSAICGLGQTITQVIIGRLIAGVGGAGINCLVAIVIADMVPIREVASWRSYVNIAATSGRSLGGPIGGFLTDTVGWRWSFLIQCPPTLLALLLVVWKLKVPLLDEEDKHSQLSKLRRIDFLGAILLSVSIVCGLTVLDLGGQRMLWTSTKVLTLFAISIVSGTLFLVVEGFWAKEPIFPLRLLLNRDVVTSYVNLAFQTGAQGAMMLLVPMYFQVSAHASVTNAGAHLMPSVIGNACGGLLTGYIIKRTGRYKSIAILGCLSSSFAYTLMILRWHGHTSFLESLYIIPGGFGNGIALSASFIALTAGVDGSQIAIASSGLYLSSSLGMVTGLSVAASILQSTLHKELRIRLEGWVDRETIISRALNDIEYVRLLEGKLGELVVAAYVKCLAYTHAVSLIGALIALTAAFCIKEHRL